MSTLNIRKVLACIGFIEIMTLSILWAWYYFPPVKDNFSINGYYVGLKSVSPNDSFFLFYQFILQVCNYLYFIFYPIWNYIVYFMTLPTRPINVPFIHQLTRPIYTPSKVTYMNLQENLVERPEPPCMCSHLFFLFIFFVCSLFQTAML